MPNVTQPPVTIDPIVGAVDDTEGAHFIGPFVVGLALYVILMGEEITHKLSVWKSIDNGITWVSQDAANRPATSQTFDPILEAGVFTICYTARSINDPLKVITFDTTTDTFGAPSVDGPTTGGNARIARFAGGDLCIWYGAFGGLQSVLLYSGGVFGAATVVPNAKNDAVAILIGANNVAQLFYFDLVAIGPTFFNNLFFRTFTNGGVLGAEQTVFHTAADVLRSSEPIGRPVIWNGDFQIPAYGGGPNGTQVGVWTGTPYTAPVWTFRLVDPTVQPVGAGDFTPFALIDGTNNLILFYSTLDIPTGPVTMSFAIDSGAGFGAPTVFYDELANPPLNPPLTDGPTIDVFVWGVTRYTNGKYGVIAGFCGCPTAQCIGAGYLIDGGAAPPPPPLLPSPPTYWNPGSAVSLLCEKNYPWSVPPKDRIPVNVKNSIPAPAANVLTEIWSYEVPDGFWFVFDTLLFQANVAGFVEGSGSLTFTLDVNTPTIGTALPVGRPLAKFTTNVGDLSEPVKSAPVQLYQGDILRAKVNITDNTLGVGLPNVIHAAVEGWLFPHSRL